MNAWTSVLVAFTDNDRTTGRSWRDMGRQRQLTVYDNTEVASGVRDGDSSAEQQDVVAVDPVYKLTRAEP